MPTKALGLLGFLAVSAHNPVERQRIANLLWPHSKPRDARHSLSQALYTLRKNLGSDVITADDDVLSLGNLATDIEAFKTLTKLGRWSPAAELYGGEILEGIQVPDALDFSHWIDGIRATFAATAEQVALELVSDQLWSEATALLDVLLSRDPHNPNLVRAKLTTLRAISTPQKTRDLLETLPPELQSSLSEGQTYGLYAGAVPSHLFVGRKEAIAWLEERMESSTDGDSELALIDGEAGIGKSALIRRFSRLLALRGFRVLTAVAYEAEQNVPLSVVSQWVEAARPSDLAHLADLPWFASLERFFPSLRELQSGDVSLPESPLGYHGILESLRRLFVEMASEKPLLLVMDDAHCADPTSLSFVHYLLRRSESAPLFVIGSLRANKDAPSNPMRNWPHVSCRTLLGLTHTETRELVANTGLAIKRGPGEIDDIRDQTGGNPLLVMSLARELAQGIDALADPPKSIIDFFKPRLQNRSPTARKILVILAIIGETSDLDRLFEVAGVGPEEGRSALSELARESLVDQDGDLTALRHGLVGEVALSLSTPSEKQRLHGRAARIFGQAGTVPTPLLALSHDVAGNRADAYDASMRAVRACDVLHANSEKEFFLKLALSNAPTETAEVRVRLRLAELLIFQRRFDEALDVLDTTSLNQVEKQIRNRAEILRLRIQAEMTTEVDAIRDVWRQVRSLSQGIPTPKVANCHYDIARVAFELGMGDVAREIGRKVERDLAKSTLTADTVHHLLPAITIAGLLDGYRAALGRLEELPRSEREDPANRVVFLATEATIMVAAGQLPEAERLFAQSLGIVERFALFDDFYTINNNMGVCLMEQGKFDEAEGHFEAASEYATADLSPTHHSTARDNLTILAYERGDYSRAHEAGLSLVTNREVAGTRSLMSLHAIIGLSGLELGKLSRCRESERELRILLDRHGHFGGDLSYVHAFLARMAALRGEEEDAIRALGEAASYYRDRNLPARMRLELERCRLLLRTDQDCRPELDRIRAELRGTGAAPLATRAQELLDRADHRFN